MSGVSSENMGVHDPRNDKSDVTANLGTETPDSFRHSETSDRSSEDPCTGRTSMQAVDLGATGAGDSHTSEQGITAGDEVCIAVDETENESKLQSDSRITDEAETDRQKCVQEGSWEKKELPLIRTAQEDSTEDQAVEKPSPLSEIFAEERFGKDKDGVAFFKQIAGEEQGVQRSDIRRSHSAPFGSKLGSEFPSSTEKTFEFDVDEIYSAWIPSEKTKRLITAAATSPADQFCVEKEMITTPMIIVLEDLEDPVKSAIDEVSPVVAQQRHVLSLSDVSHDHEGVGKLIEAGSYHSAVNLTTHLLRSQSVGENFIVQPTPESLQLWFVRIALLVKLKLFSLAEAESETFGDLDKPDLYYEFHRGKYGSKKGCMVPFSLRLLFAEIPQYLGNFEMTLNKLYALHHVVLKIKQNLCSGKAEDGTQIDLSDSRRDESLKVWSWRECRILYSVLNCFLSQKDYTMAISVAESLLEKDPVHTSQINSALGRIFLQLGDIKSAQDYFGIAASTSSLSDSDDGGYDAVVNKALLALALGENEKAYNLYKEALVLRPSDPLLINNLSVCLLYMGRLKESLTLLEQAAHRDPKAYLNDNIMFNICTLYELESSHCTVKKQALLKLVSRYADDSFSVSSLKIPVPGKP